MTNTTGSLRRASAAAMAMGDWWFVLCGQLSFVDDRCALVLAQPGKRGTEMMCSSSVWGVADSLMDRAQTGTFVYDQLCGIGV